MPNKFKYNKLGSEADSIFKGNWAINNTPANTGGGPSSATSFYHGANIPVGGYTVYSPNGVFVANNDTELVGKVNSLGADVTDISQALTWAAAQSTHMVLNKPIDNIVTSGLALNVDASHVSSFNDSKPTVNVLPASNRLLTSYNDHGGTHTTDAGFPLFGNASLRNTSNPAQDWNGVYLTGLSSILTPGVTYTYSFYIYFTTSNTSITYFGYGAPGFTGVQGKWNRVSTTFVATSQDYFYVTLQYSNGLPVSTYYLANLQIEAKSSATPFVNGTRSQNSTLYDLSGNNKNGTLTNGPTLNSNGYITFDGNDDYISILNPLNQLNASQVWSVSALVKLNAGTSGPQYIINGLNNGVAADWYNSGPLLYLNGGANDYYTYGSGYIGGTGWKHLTYLFNNSTGFRKIYKNGILIGDAAGPNYTSTPSGQAATWYLGQMAGSISSLQVYNRVISPTEILQNYHGAPIVTDGLTFAVDAGNLVSYESGSATTYSLIGSETGTLVNGVGYNTGNGGSWTFDGGDDYIQLNSSVIPAGNEISISFWNFGINAPNSSIIAASFNSSDQTLNVHLPWSNNGIYWDCGYPFNRIDKIATNAEYQGWHNWVFTKNATTGNMSIYLDGALWHSGSGHTSTIPVMNVARMGSYWNSQLCHSGRIAQCLIHNRALTADEVTQNFRAHRNRFGI
jgi:hypothetical protein